jgi:D-alanyl-D-alanine carboxypeptidase
VEPAASGQAVDAESLLFRRRLDSILAGDPYYRFLVDKSHSLPASYAPEDLVDLGARSYRVNKAGMQLRAAAAESLETMAAAAASEGIRLLVSSAYRSFDYQRTVYERNVSQLGQAAADRESARPGQSQHQLGLAVDFGTVDDSFYGTAQERWLAANAGRFGWSLSYPQDKEEITGYRWESWHYRYVGLSVGSFIDEYFQGIQQYALEFLSAYAVAAH